MSSNDTESFDLDSVFTEPPRPPTPEPTDSIYTRVEERVISDDDWKEIKIRLVGSHPLWAHYLWNAALALASFLDANIALYKDRHVLELGAGGALPSIVAAKNGAEKVVVTDYPDESLINNMFFNVSENVNEEVFTRIDVQGYIWGRSPEALFKSLPPSSSKFDAIILSDLIFNHSQHDALLKTCALTISEDPSACVLVFYSHHRPHLAHRDMEFFTKAKEGGWVCKEIVTRNFPPMFPKDSGDESIRSTVHGWKLTRGTILD